jgi:pSer/pThr/pTyr-binding forkhead associated (FHA) protein
MIKLIIEDDEGKTTVVPLIRDEITIGRKEGNTIRLTERNVSRRHAKLLKQNGAIFIEDLNSYNGIKVNGNRISGRVAIAEGDRIQIGDYVLGLKVEGAVEVVDAVRPAQTQKLPRAEELPTAEISSQETQLAVQRADAATSTQVKPENVGRLVCISNNFPGQEWSLDKPIMVLGRTEDNDVVINHRSISRHHARVTEENGRYTIVDMQSSNGVRVNGEEYGKVELRRGDLIDLGHVRLRFVAAGEDFVFARDASVVDISKGGPSRGGIYAAIVVIALLGVGFVIWRLAKKDTPGGVAADAGQVAVGDTHKVVSPVGPAPEVLLAKISRAVASEQWADAIAACDQLSGEAKANAEANCAKAKLEKEAFEHFDAAHKANLQNQHLDVILHHDKIPEESVYKKRDLDVVQAARTKYLAQARANLDELVRGKACDQARALARQIKEIAPEDTAAEKKAARCGAVAVAPVKPPPRVRPPRGKRPPPVVVVKPPPPPTPSQQDLVQARLLLKQAQQAYIGGNHASSIQLAKQVLQLKPGDNMATQILGASSCYLKNVGQAKWAYGRLPQKMRNLLKNICLKVGINLQ